MNTQIEMAATPALALAPVTPMHLIEMAAQRGDVSIERMQQLFDLQLRWEANEAQKAFNAAFSAFKSEAVRIVKNVTVSDGPLKGKKHADLFGVVDVVTPSMSKHGLSHSWKLTRDEPTWMEVTCTIKHVLGHSESFPMGGPPDTGPGRNALQARGSTNTYLERYTLLQAIGMAPTNADNDGNGGSGSIKGLEETEYVALCDSIESANTIDELKKFFAAAYRRAETAKDKQAMTSFIEKKNERRKGLAA